MDSKILSTGDLTQRPVARGSMSNPSCLTTAVIACIIAVHFAPTAGAAEDQEQHAVHCGSYCLYVALGALDADLPEYKAFENAIGPPSARGYSMEQLSQFAQTRGFEALGVKTTCENISSRTGRLACIAHLDEHYVLLIDCAAGEVSIVDPPRQYSMSLEAFEHRWDGDALLISKEPLESEESLDRRLRYRQTGRQLVILIAIVAPLVGVAFLARRRFLQITPARAILVASLALFGCSKHDEPAVGGSSSGQIAMAAPPQAKIYIPEMERALGDVASFPGAMQTIEYEIINQGTAPLAINELIKSCGCTRCALSSSVIAPGASARLSVYVEDDGVTEQQRLITVDVVSNDPKRPSIRLIAAWSSVFPVKLSPTSIDFDTICLGERAERRVSVSVRGGIAGLPESINVSPSEGLSAGWSDQETRDELVVAVHPNSRGSQRGEVQVRFAGRDYRLPVHWTVRDRIAASPTSLMLKSGFPGEQRAAQIRLSCTPPDTLEIQQCHLQLGDERQPLTFRKVSETQWIVGVQIVLPDVIGVWQAKASVVCTSPETSEIAIPITAIISERKDE